MSIGGEEVFTLSAAAARLGLSRKTLWLQVKAGSLHAIRSGSIWLVTGTEVERYERENKGKRGRRPKVSTPDA